MKMLCSFLALIIRLTFFISDCNPVVDPDIKGPVLMGELVFGIVCRRFHSVIRKRRYLNIVGLLPPETRFWFQRDLAWGPYTNNVLDPPSPLPMLAACKHQHNTAPAIALTARQSHTQTFFGKVISDWKL